MEPLFTTKLAISIWLQTFWGIPISTPLQSTMLLSRKNIKDGLHRWIFMNLMTMIPDLSQNRYGIELKLYDIILG